MADLLAGQTSMILVNISVVERHANAGKVKIIAAATPKRLLSLPDLEHWGPLVKASGAKAD